jgi:hypothetical protein
MIRTFAPRRRVRNGGSTGIYGRFQIAHEPLIPEMRISLGQGLPSEGTSGVDQHIEPGHSRAAAIARVAATSSVSSTPSKTLAVAEKFLGESRRRLFGPANQVDTGPELNRDSSCGRA